MRPVLELVAASGFVANHGVVIVEHFKKQLSPEQAGALMLYREARYGDTVLAFYHFRNQEPETSGQKSGK